jgi:hypothetical protein
MDPAEPTEMDMVKTAEMDVKAISFDRHGRLRLDRITPKDVIDLLHLGWTLTASGAIPGTAGGPAATGPTTSSRPAPSTSAPRPRPPPKMKRSALSKSIRHAKSKTKALFTTLKDAAKGKPKNTRSNTKSKNGNPETHTDTPPARETQLPPIQEEQADPTRPPAPCPGPSTRQPPRANSARVVKPSLPFSPGSWLLHKRALKRARGKRNREEEEPGVPPTPSRARSLMAKRLKDHNSDPPGTRYPLPGEPRFRSTPKRLGERFERM